ncbi:helix-turn-helix domain-containing protein [Lysobacter enzymogenes]|uniref:helix-turn-helix domain-containing protein n=1 Tax=Lysobacter enzymogenes TaxID=69 RepID=UPI001A966090|nr:helix-turn-helix domain-containing protein [Lysobacter enzymogenes]QQP97676.1 helix-turn-helix transcriptional regulator [Lysobacter enzymogenes]
MSPAYRTRHERNAALATHRHRDAYVALVLDGDYTESSLDGPLPCAPGTLVLHPPFHAHGDRFGRSGASAVNLELSAIATPGVVADAGFAARAWRVHDLREAREVFERAPQRLAELLACATPQAAAALPDWQGELLRRMAEDEREIAELARELGVSAEHASRALGRSFGMSPRALRREARWRRALQLLGAPMPLVQVAAAAGFADQSHLHRIVVAHAGCTPLQLRRQLAQERLDQDSSARERLAGPPSGPGPAEGQIKCVQDPAIALAA